MAQLLGNIPDDTKERQQKLIDFVGRCTKDPLLFVMTAFPWGEGELREYLGPDKWQIEVLEDIGRALHQGEKLDTAVQIAVASGHGIGKSALVAWVVLWAISTFPETKGVVTANTETQLRTKTWAELAKWFNMCVTKPWFEFNATSLAYKYRPKTWRIDAIAWSKDNTEAFAGLHNKGKRILLIFDEASAIDDLIWEVAEGALTDSKTQIIWCGFGNPTQSTGRFRDCFGRFKHRWNTRQIDSRTVAITNKTQLQKWVDDYGEDSDFVRVRVRGVFPQSGTNTLFTPEDCERSMAQFLREDDYAHAAMILGVDVARQGLDRTAIFPRQGRRAYDPRVMRIQDSMLVADQVARAWNELNADAVFIDMTGGWGAGVYDRLVQLRYDPVGVQFAGRARDARYANKRAEMHFDMANWLKSEMGVIPKSSDLVRELCAQTYYFSNDRFILDDKEKVRAIIGESPDLADALAMTFAFPVAPKTRGIDLSGGRQSRTKIAHEYDPFSDEAMAR